MPAFYSDPPDGVAGHASLGEVTLARAEREPNAPFLLAPDDLLVSRAELIERVRAAAGGLAARGVGAGARVVSLTENSADMFVAMYATWWLGAVFVPLNPAHHRDTLERMIAKVTPAVVLVPQDFLDGSVELGAPAAPVDRLDGDGAPVKPAWSDPRAPAAIYFSSGTTGVSKGCVMSHDYMLWTGEEFWRATELGRGDVVHTQGPLHHVNAIWAFAGSVVNGTVHAFETKFSASRFWQRTAATGATVFDYVGAIVSILIRSKADPPPDSALRAGVGGGARGSEIERFEERFHGVRLLECYGLTECTLPIYQRLHERRVGSIGELSDYFDARVVTRAGTEAAAEEVGELWLRPRHPRAMFSGYWNQPKADRAAFEGDWFRTGDYVRRDEDGYLYYIDRGNQVIRRRGENISAYELEGIFLTHPDVHRCAAVGVPAELGDDDVLLAVESVDGRPLDPAALRNWAADRMASFMVPRYVRVMDRLPTTGSERVEKHKLRSAGVTADTFDGGDQRRAEFASGLPKPEERRNHAKGA